MKILYAGMAVAAASYLIGSLSFAILVCYAWKRDDIRKYGSGNAGMTNVLRVYGIAPAAVTLVGDFLKGIAAIIIGRKIFLLFGITEFDSEYISGLFVLLGHIFPLYFKFKGGKGVLTNLGIMLMINYKVFLITIAIMLVAIAITRMMSVGSIVGAMIYPIVTWIMIGSDTIQLKTDILFAAIFGLLVIVMHRNNIKNILNGTERKIWKTKKEKNIKNN